MDFLGPFRAFGYYIGVCDPPETEEEAKARTAREAYLLLKIEMDRIVSDKKKKEDEATSLCAPSIHIIDPCESIDSIESEEVK